MRAVRALLAVLLATYLVLGLAHLVQELGTVPTYGDTFEYMILATHGGTDGYRGIFYPLLLRGADTLLAGRLLADVQVYADQPLTQLLGPLGVDSAIARRLGFPEYPSAFVWIQLLQLLALAAALAYAVRAAAPRTGSWGTAIVLVLMLDPVILHLGMSVMVDALTLAAIVLCCGGMARLWTRQSRELLAWLAVFLGGLAAALLRGEKGAVILVSGLVVAVVGWQLRRRRDAGLRPRAALSLLVVLSLAVTAAIGTQRALEQPSGRWSHRVSWLQERIIRPHLADIHPQLPASLQQQIRIAHARAYDASPLEARRLMLRITRGDSETVAEVTDALAQAVVRHRPAPLIVDAAADVCGNALPTLSFYFDLARWWGDGSPESAVTNVEPAPLTWSKLTARHPRLAKVRVACSWLLLIAGGTLWLSRWFGRSGPSIDPRRAPALIPFLVLACVNALAFAAGASFVHVRYALPAHALFLALVAAPVVSRVLTPSQGRKVGF